MPFHESKSDCYNQTQTTIHAAKISALIFLNTTEYVCIKKQSNEHQNSCTLSDTTVRYHMAKTYSKRSGNFNFSKQKAMQYASHKIIHEILDENKSFIGLPLEYPTLKQI